MAIARTVVAYKKYLSFSHFHFLWTKTTTQLCQTTDWLQSRWLWVWVWSLGIGPWVEGPETETWDLRPSQAKSSRCRGVWAASACWVQFSLIFFYFFACFLHFFLHQFRRSLSSAMWGKNMAATKSSDERKLLRRKELAETRQRSLWGNTKGSGRSVGRVATVLGKVTPAKGRVNGGQI